MRRKLLCAMTVWSMALCLAAPAVRAEEADTGWDDYSTYEEDSLYEQDVLPSEEDIVTDESIGYETEAVYNDEAEENEVQPENIPDGLFLSETEQQTAPAPDIPVQAYTYTHDGKVTLIDGSVTDQPVLSFEDAAQVITLMLGDLGGNEYTSLEPWRILYDANGNVYYVFRQMYADTTVLGGAVKVITDSQGVMTGLTSSLVSRTPDAEETVMIPGGQAEQIVLQHMADQKMPEAELLGAYTSRVILPVALTYDVNSDEEGCRYVWAVYTDNPGSRTDRSNDLPYLAHYVTMSGEYLYSLPTILPGDEAGESGFDASYVFEFMEPAEYTGYVDLSGGEEKEISVTLMRDRRTGTYYLGNLERRIVVGDCYEFLHNGNKVVLESSQDNLEWDQKGLLALYNYCRAYDYYKAIGWSGADGMDTPILILNNYCDEDHNPVDNASYAGHNLGWELFLASQANDYSQCLDVLAHEFTHCVTDSVMTSVVRQNDCGAISEALSDIQGKTCDRLLEGAENAGWIIGNNSVRPLRSMEQPHGFGQPEYTWDLYYTPAVQKATALNDRGGIHTNSSLLNRLAYLLYDQGGMTLEEGRSFWFTVACALVPGTDYAQLADLLPWALKAAGLEQYGTSLAEAIGAVRLGQNRIPDEFDPDRALLTLTVPDTETFADENWIMMVCTMDVDKLIGSMQNLIAHVTKGDLSVLPQFLQDAMAEDREPAETEAASGGAKGAETEAASGGAKPAAGETVPEEKKGLFDAIADALMENGPDAAAEVQEAIDTKAAEAKRKLHDLKEEIAAWFRGTFPEVYYSSSTNGGIDGHVMQLVSTPGYTIPVLIHGQAGSDRNSLIEFSSAVYLGGRWIDLRALDEIISLKEKGGDVLQASLIQELLTGIENSMNAIHSPSDVLNLLFTRIGGGGTVEIPNTGLEVLPPVEKGLTVDLGRFTKKEVSPRKSRPKLQQTA